MDRQLRLFVEGQVQGVGYRMFIYRQALLLDLEGYVRNLPDGRVEICVTGEDETVEKLVHMAQQGPPAARVTGISRTEESAAERFGGFRVEA